METLAERRNWKNGNLFFKKTCASNVSLHVANICFFMDKTSLIKHNVFYSFISAVFLFD